MNRIKEVQQLYKLVLNREADNSGLKNYANSGLDLYQIQLALWNSDEFKSKQEVGFPKDSTEIETPIKIFVVNLKRRKDRLQIIEKRLNDLSLKNYEIIEAVDGKELPEDLSEFYDKESACKIRRNLERSEIGCALSHINIAKKIIDENLEYAIILEDDAEPTLKFKEFIKNFHLEPNKFDFLMLGYFSSNEWFNGKLKTKVSPYTVAEKRSIVYLDKTEFSIGDISIHKAHYPTQMLDFVNGAHAYMISKRGAQFILDKNYPVKLESDNVWNYYQDECELIFTNPILVNIQWEDSDINEERKLHLYNFENYSDMFKLRVNHPDFGT